MRYNYAVEDYRQVLLGWMFTLNAKDVKFILCLVSFVAGMVAVFALSAVIVTAITAFVSTITVTSAGFTSMLIPAFLFFKPQV